MTAEIFDLAKYESKKKPEPKSIEETLAGIFEAALSEKMTADSPGALVTEDGDILNYPKVSA